MYNTEVFNLFLNIILQYRLPSMTPLRSTPLNFLPHASRIYIADKLI